MSYTAVTQTRTADVFDSRLFMPMVMDDKLSDPASDSDSVANFDDAIPEHLSDQDDRDDPEISSADLSRQPGGTPPSLAPG